MRKLLLLAAAAMTMAAPAHAQPHPDGRGRPARLFLSPSGEPFRGPDGLSVWFVQADADHDGRLTAAEFAADAARAFARFDTDHDGVLTGLEIQAYERDDAPEITEIGFEGPAGGGRGGRGFAGRRRGGPGGRGGGHGGPPPGEHGVGAAAGSSDSGFRPAGGSGAARFSLLNEPQPLLAADLDVDGKVSRAEWERATARRFDRLDAAHAGVLTLAGLRPPPAKRSPLRGKSLADSSLK